MIVSSASIRYKKWTLIGQRKGRRSEKTLTKPSGDPVIIRRKVVWNDHDNGRVVCRSLELMTALGRIATGLFLPLSLEVAW